MATYLDIPMIHELILVLLKAERKVLGYASVWPLVLLAFVLMMCLRCVPVLLCYPAIK